MILTGQQTHKSATLQLRVPSFLENNRQRYRELTHLYTPEEDRQKGYAGNLLKRVCTEADAYKIILVCMPCVYDKNGVNSEQLFKLYEKYGFKLIQENPPLMARPINGNQ